MYEYRHLNVDRPKPRLKQCRLNVVQLWHMVHSVDGGVEAVASRWDVPVEAVEEAVQYYSDHREELQAVVEEEEEDAMLARQLQREGYI